MLLFVYGTLRRGASNHAQLSGARFAGLARTQARYELVDMDGYPALLEGGTNVVVGELYEVSDSLSRELDAFEEVPALYQRRPVAMADCEGNCASSVDAYVMQRARAGKAPKISSGDWFSTRTARLETRY
jgi:gamma-glutamylcyclotransferase (GGCT)/AIG2-like uncharacterized protein YtfP